MEPIAFDGPSDGIHAGGVRRARPGGTVSLGQSEQPAARARVLELAAPGMSIRAAVRAAGARGGLAARFRGTYCWCVERLKQPALQSRAGRRRSVFFATRDRGAGRVHARRGIAARAVIAR
jgi:hypothetical protein